MNVSLFGFWFLIVYGILMITMGIYGASQHGKTRGTYNGAFETISALVGVVFILIAFGVI